LRRDIVDAMSVRIALLGEVRLHVDDVEMPRLSPKARALVASLALRSGEAVSVGRLSEELWPALALDRAKHVVQVRVGEIRKLLSMTSCPRLLESVGPGYRLNIEDDAVDANRFIALFEDAERCAAAGDSLGSVSKLRSALGLWRGSALADTQSSLFLEAEAARLDELRLSAIEDRVEAELVAGCHHRLVPELRSLVAACPLRERLWVQLVMALYRSGRQADALRACSSVRRLLREEVGLGPGPALRAVEAAVLAHDPALTWKPQSGSARLVVPDPFERPSAESAVDVAPPPVRYVKAADGVSLAYQVAGEGPIDLVIVPGYISELDNWWEAWSGRLVRRLSSFARLILFDKRGVGLSDRPEHIVIDDWVEDVRTVLDAVGSVRPAVLGMSAGGAIAMLFAATHPDRTGPLVIYAGSPRSLTDGTSYPVTRTVEEAERMVEALERAWGTGDSLARWCPSVGDDPAIRSQFGQYERRSASPGSASNYLRMLRSIDVRAVLPMITAPTHIIHPRGDRSVPVEVARYVARHVPGATLCELDTDDHLIWFSEKVDAITAEVEHFVTSNGPSPLTGRSLITVMAVLVDHSDPAVIERWREITLRHGGRPHHSTAHLVATFTGPSRALRCADAIVAHLSTLGAIPRVGVHAGYDRPTCTAFPGSVGGEACRLAAMADPGEAQISRITRDLAGDSPRC
jgi:DNA-binding SARP family transcriptional activator/pimeloyl-ACP methyl ester carboxylesterase